MSPESKNPKNPPRRPDLSTFFSTLEHVDTTSTSNEHSLPIPSDVSAAFRSLGEAFQHMRMYRSGEGPLDGMIESLLTDAEAPPREVKGVSQGFLDGEHGLWWDQWKLIKGMIELDRVPKKSLKKDMDCPICGNPFLEGRSSTRCSALFELGLIAIQTSTL